MKKSIYTSVGVLLVVVVVLSFAVYAYFGQEREEMEIEKEETAVKKYFNQPQWENIDFFNRKYDMWVAPSLGEFKEEKIIEASKKAGISSPILINVYPDELPKTAQFYQCVLEKELTTKEKYEMRFFVLADTESEEIYSIWIAVVPLVKYKSGYYGTTEDEFIYAVTDTPEKIEKDMLEYFNEKGL
jgi:hypothetical protein